MQSGEIIVSDTDTVNIALNNKPVRVTVEFTDGISYTPCNPHYYDQLIWAIDGNQLSITWQVSGIREIKWVTWTYWSEVLK